MSRPDDSDKERILSLLEEGFDALEDEDPETALESGREALSLDPDDTDAHWLVGAAHLDLLDVEAAVVHLRRAVEIDPENAEAFAALGAALFERLDLRGAIRALRSAIDLIPDYADAHWWLGLVLEREGDAEGAAKSFARATALDRKAFPAPHCVSEAEFRQLVEKAIKKLPVTFRESLKNLAIMVEALPDDQVLAGDPPLSPSILGLHVGTPLPERGGSGGRSGDLPNTIFLFQKNIERAASTRDELVEEIEVTLLHEIGHYLGLDEDDVDARGLH